MTLHFHCTKNFESLTYFKVISKEWWKSFYKIVNSKIFQPKWNWRITIQNLSHHYSRRDSSHRLLGFLFIGIVSLSQRSRTHRRIEQKTNSETTRTRKSRIEENQKQNGQHQSGSKEDTGYQVQRDYNSCRRFVDYIYIRGRVYKIGIRVTFQLITKIHFHVRLKWTINF